MIIIASTFIVRADRFSELTRFEIGIVYIFLGLFAFIMISMLTWLSVSLTKKWMKNRISAFFTVLLWVPYSIILIKLINTTFPVQTPYTDYGAGFQMLGIVLVFPLYVLVLNVFGTGIGLTEEK